MLALLILFQTFFEHKAKCFCPLYLLVVQSLSHIQLCDSMDWSRPYPLAFTISWSLLKLRSIELVMPSNHLILCCPFLLLSSILPSIKVFSNEWALCIRWPKYWSFSISASNDYSGLIFFILGKRISLPSLTFYLHLPNLPSSLISFRSDFFPLLVLNSR